MPDGKKAKATTATNLTIPEEVVKQFPEFVELIKGSQSMDVEERQYWVDVLPIMSEDQLNNLKSILANEKKQIEETNKAYSKDMGQLVDKTKGEFDEATYFEKKKVRVAAEKQHEEEEAKQEAALLEAVKKM
jgi:hypothetical protein